MLTTETWGDGEMWGDAHHRGVEREREGGVEREREGGGRGEREGERCAPRSRGHHPV